jgi:hypothetical protein
MLNIKYLRLNVKYYDTKEITQLITNAIKTIKTINTKHKQTTNPKNEYFIINN